MLAPSARAGCGATASSAAGATPLRVTFTAACSSTVYHWDFGDGQAADGASVTHVYAAGRFAPVLTTDAGPQALPQLASISLRLIAPHRARYAAHVTLRAQVVPAD